MSPFDPQPIHSPRLFSSFGEKKKKNHGTRLLAELYMCVRIKMGGNSLKTGNMRQERAEGEKGGK